MTHILVECPELIASVRLGVLRPLHYYEQQRLAEIRFLKTASIKNADIVWCDVYICVRGFESLNKILVRTAKNAGRFVVYFLDDDLMDIPPDVPSARFAIKCGVKKNIPEILLYADVLWAVNPLIAEKYGKYCGRTVISRVPSEAVELDEEKFFRRPLRVLYAGSTDHKEMVREQLAPAVERLVQERPGEFEFMFIGADPGLDGVDGVSFHPFFDSYAEYQRTVFDGGFALGLAPLRNEPFYQCKYYNKFIEYASSGIAGIYAKIKPYTYVVEDEKNGFLCGLLPEDWYAAILRAGEDRIRTLACAKAGLACVQCDFSLEKIGDQLARDVPELAEYRADGTVSLPILSIWLRYNLGRAGYLVKAFGLASIAVIAFKAVRKLFRWITKKR